jgi:Predicted membrane protein
MGIISWIILGALAGWIGSMFTGDNSRMGAGANIVVGIIGAFIGGFLFSGLGGTGITGFNFWSLFVAVIGSVVLLVVINLFTRKRESYR